MKIKKLLRKDKGFSLIELLIVIGILMILATIIIPRFSTSTEDTKIATDAANVKLLQSAVERYYFDHGEYPTDAGGEKLDQETLVDEGYINEIAGDPWKAGREYEIDDHGFVQAFKKDED